MLSLIPISTFSHNNASSLLTGSIACSSVRPRPNERFCIPRPPSWKSRHECVGAEWHNEHKDKTFRVLQYRKCDTAPWHEFILLFLTDGSVCRVERMGDATPNRRHDALFHKGIAAVDYMQVFPPTEKHTVEADPEKSILVAEIRYPEELKLLSVLDICHAIQLDSEAKRYTLQIFNCYFFAWSIILILGRQVARWGSAFVEPNWSDACDQTAKTLDSISKQRFSRLAFRLEELIGDSTKDTIVETVIQHIRQQNGSLDQRAKSLLWTRQAPEIIKQRLEHLIRHSVSEKTFRIIFPEFGRFNLRSPTTPVEARNWERDRQTFLCDPKPSPVSPVESMALTTPSSANPNTGFHQLPTLYDFIRAPMYEASSLVLSALYSGVRSIAQPEIQGKAQSSTIPPDDWRTQLHAFLGDVVDRDYNPGLENRLLSIINSHPSVHQAEWREALIQSCDEQVPFFKASPLPRLWDQWLWDAIKEDIYGEIGGLIPKSEQVNIGLFRPGRGQEWMTNGQLQVYISERMEEHSQLVHKYSRQATSDIYHEISEAIEGVWERVSLGDGKRDCLGLASIFRAVQGVVVIPPSQELDSVD